MKLLGGFLGGFLFIMPLIGGIAAPASSPKLLAHFVTTDTPEAAEIQRIGEQAINYLANVMIREVTQAMANAGPETAVDICHLKALTITKGAIAGLPRITAIKRTSLKLRNPANAPDEAELLVLTYIQQQLEDGEPLAGTLIQQIESPPAALEWRVYKPLGVMHKCLVCHGDPAEQSPALRTKLNSLYPTDQAAGYHAGEWRGVIRVTVAAASLKLPAATLPAHR